MKPDHQEDKHDVHQSQALHVHAEAHGASVDHESQHGEEHHDPHELPNAITVLNTHFPNFAPVKFLHQWETSFFAILIALVVAVICLKGARKVEKVPSGIQNFFEALVEALESFVTGIIGPDGKQHVPFLGTLFLYTLLMNWSGLVPLMKSPTAYWSTTMANAIITIVYIQIAGIRSQGIVNYIKHMAGNPSNIIQIVLIPLMLTLNIILELIAVPFSLSLRLFANISSEDKLLLSFAQMGVETVFAWPLQIFANLLAIVFSLVQAFVFTLLSSVYIALVSHHEEHHESDEEHAAHAEASTS